MSAGEEARSSFLAEVVSQLAQLLKDNGFEATLRDRKAAFGSAGDAVAARQRERQQQLAAAGRRLMLAAVLASACFTGHLAHVWPGALTAFWFYCPAYLHRLTVMVLPKVDVAGHLWSLRKRCDPDMRRARCDDATEVVQARCRHWSSF